MDMNKVIYHYKMCLQQNLTGYIDRNAHRHTQKCID